MGTPLTIFDEIGMALPQQIQQLDAGLTLSALLCQHFDNPRVLVILSIFAIQVYKFQSVQTIIDP
jgi:hypothetical protein